MAIEIDEPPLQNPRRSAQDHHQRSDANAQAAPGCFPSMATPIAGCFMENPIYYTLIINYNPTAPTPSETVFGVVFWGLNTLSEGIWSIN